MATKKKIREFEKIAAKNRATAKRIAAMRQKVILGFAAPATREGVHSSLVIAPNNVVQLHKRQKPVSGRPAKGDPAKQRPESFRYQFGHMVPRFQQSSRYMAQIAKAKRAHLTEVEQLVHDSKVIKHIDNQIAKALTLGKMKHVHSLRKTRTQAVKKIQRQYEKTRKAKGRVIAAANDAGLSGLWDSFKGAMTDIGVGLKETITQGVTGVIQAKTQSEVTQAEVDAQKKLLEKQLEVQRQIEIEKQKTAAILAQQTPVQQAVQTVTGTAQAALEAPWYRNPMVLLPAAVAGYLILKK